MSARLAVIETHPIQYHAPVYRVLQQEFGVAVTALYGSDFSIAGYHDKEFGATFQWDTDLVSGYDAKFLSRVEKGGARSADAVTMCGLREQLCAANPDAVMLVGYSPRFHRDAFLTAWRAGYHLLFRGETTDHAVARSSLKHTARSLGLRAFYSQFRALLYVGARSREHFLRLGVSPARLFFSPYCIDTTPFQLDAAARTRLREATRSAFNIAPNDVVMLFSGKLSPRKAPELLLHAVKNFSEPQRANTALLFVGDGELRESLAHLADETPRVRAYFAGFQNQTQLSRFYHAADLFALPSRLGETWGLVVNEALHHGLPCVVSDRVGCAPDLVIPNETGEMFHIDDMEDSGNRERLQRALERVLHSLAIAARVGDKSMREKCIQRAKMYSTRRAAQGISEAFEDVMRKR